jgi:hypothetical protein|tara:strand:- start:113 stop:349 length:237 start_codon:yes stop_codon:yes gene_type:complete
MRGCPLLLVLKEEEEEEEEVEAIIACARVVCVKTNILCVFIYLCVCQCARVYDVSLLFFKIFYPKAYSKNVRKKRLKQ